MRAPKAVDKSFLKKFALADAASLSIIGGAFTAVISRSYTSSWKQAGRFGVGATAIAMMFLAPTFLYKAGINTNTAPKDVQKKILADVNGAIDGHAASLQEKIGNYSKNVAKKAI